MLSPSTNRQEKAGRFREREMPFVAKNVSGNSAAGVRCVLSLWFQPCRQFRQFNIVARNGTRTEGSSQSIRRRRAGSSDRSDRSSSARRRVLDSRKRTIVDAFSRGQAAVRSADWCVTCREGAQPCHSDQAALKKGWGSAVFGEVRCR
jgi:hypothetical protein